MQLISNLVRMENNRIMAPEIEFDPRFWGLKRYTAPRPRLEASSASGLAGHAYNLLPGVTALNEAGRVSRVIWNTPSWTTRLITTSTITA